jgi:hypothetical protein
MINRFIDEIESQAPELSHPVTKRSDAKTVVGIMTQGVTKIELYRASKI